MTQKTPIDIADLTIKNGHLGDLPVLVANQAGVIRTPVLAPRLRVHDLYGHSLIIHAHGDNYRDHPRALGGGGARYACGVIKKGITTRGSTN